MSDTWRPFTIRRNIGGDVLQAVDGWRGALRFGPKSVPFDIVVGTTLFGQPIGYDSTMVTVQVPPTVPWKEAVLVRGGFGFPTTPLDGVAVWFQSTNPNPVLQFDQQVLDHPLTQGWWYYYTLFLCVGVDPLPCEWLVGAQVEVLVPRNYQHGDKLFSLIPPYYQKLDDQQAADGRNGPLRKFANIVGFDMDYNRTLVDGVLNVYDSDRAPLKFVQQLGINLGLGTVENALGGARYRSLVGGLSLLEEHRGTQRGLHDFIFAASNYQTVVTSGDNEVLATDDAEFVGGSGHWIPFANTDVTFISDGAGTPTHPAFNAYSDLAVRKYTGGTVVPQPGAGRGVLEITELNPPQSYTSMVIVAGYSDDRVTNGISDGIAFGIPVSNGELWSFSFWMKHLAGAPDAHVIGTFVRFHPDGTFAEVVSVGGQFAPNGWVADSTAWTRYTFETLLNLGGDATGFIIPTIWWKSSTAAVLNSRYICGVEVAQIRGVGGSITPLDPDIFLTLGVPEKTLSSGKSYLGPPEA